MKYSSKSMSSIQLRKTLFSYSVLLFIIFSLFLILSITIPVYGRLKDSENSKVVHDAQIRAMAISEWSRHVKDLALQITSRTRIRQELEKYNNREISLDQLQSFTEPKLVDAMNMSEEIIGIIRLDKTGNNVAKCGEVFSYPKTKIDYTKPFSTSLSPPFENNNHYMVVVSAPIFNNAETYLGADLLLIDLCYLQNIVKDSSDLKNDQKIILGFTSDRGVSEPFSKEIVQEEKEFFHDLIPSLLIKACNGDSGIDSSSSDYVIAYKNLAIKNWGLVILQNKKLLYQSLNKRLMYWGSATVILYLTILAIFWLLLNPLANRMLLHAEELQEKITEKTKHLEKEINERKEIERERKKLTERLQTALAEIKTLNGLLPICYVCKNIKDDRGDWNQVELYIEKYSEASLEQSICPECAERLYGEEAWYMKRCDSHRTFQLSRLATNTNLWGI